MAALAGRRELTIEATPGHAYGWMPAGFESDADRPVIHRPQMAARATWAGAGVSGYGYSKRYHGIYPRCVPRVDRIDGSSRLLPGTTPPDALSEPSAALLHLHNLC